MGTRAPWSTALWLVWASGCGGGDPPATVPVEPALHLVADPGSVSIQPSQSKLVAFRLLNDKNQAIPGRTIQFSIIDDPSQPGDDAAGATLSSDSAVTNGEGAVTLQIIAGPQPTTFRIRATAAQAPVLQLTVLVTHATLAPVELVPVLVDMPVPGEELTTVRLYVLDGEGCASVRRDNLPTATPFVRTIPSDSTALFSTVTTEEPHQLVALGLDAAGVARAIGCVDLPRSLLLVDVPLRVVIPMHLFRPSPEGTYDVTSHIELRPGLTGARLATDAWRELGVCNLDPARLWLDCTIDAFKTSATDATDCRPSNDEGDLGMKLVARRGAPLAMPAGGRCRDEVDGAGAASLDAVAAQLFPVPRPPILEDLPALGAEVAQLLESVELRSVLTVAGTSTSGQYQIDHRLVSASFPASRAAIIDLVGIGVPALEARFLPGTARGSDLDLGSHGFTLRLGSTTRLAFARTSLVPRGGPADASAFVTALYGLASRNESGTLLTGCAALDAVLCADLGEARGCALTACTEGLATLRQRLDAGFLAMDGDDLDFVLGGHAPVVDSDGDGQADALGGTRGGTWSGEVRGRGGPSPLTGTWTAVRSAP